MLAWIALGAARPETPAASRPGVTTRTDRLVVVTDRLPLDDGVVLVAVEGTLLGTREAPAADVPGPASPEALVLDLYRRHGDRFPELLEGLHFVLLYDRARDLVLVANNPYQVTNAYVSETPDRLLLTRSLADQLPHLPGPRRLDWGSVHGYLANGFTMSDRTALAGVRKMLPAFVLRVEAGRASWSHHWAREMPFDRRPFDDLERHLDRYEETYRGGLRDFLDARRPESLGCLLSGGHDTSFAFIQGSRVFERPLDAFTVTFPGWAFDEERHARAICERFGGRFHPVPFVAGDLDWMVSLIRTIEEPVVSSSLPIHLCAREAARHAEAMIAGDGGDTVWGEYYPVVEFHRFARHLPRAARHAVHQAARALVAVTDWERAWELAHVAGLFDTADPYADFLRRLCTYRHYSDADQRALLRDDCFADGFHAPAAFEVPVRPDTFEDDLIAAKLYNGFYPYMSFYTTKSMKHFGTDLYLPTVHRDVLRFVASLPRRWVNGGTALDRLTNSKAVNRRFHKRALARYLEPSAIRNMSFDIPWHAILRPRPVVLERLERRLRARGWFHPDRLARLFDEFRSQPVKRHELLELKHHGYRVFALLSLEVWCIEYLDGRWTPDPDRPIPLEDYLA